VVRWFENFATRHGGATLSVVDGTLRGDGADGSIAKARLPWDREYEGPADPGEFARQIEEPIRWGLLIVRKGGFAVAGGTTPEPSAHKVGHRHVQGRSKAGGWSQQRFARRREGQARQAFEAAAAHASRVLGEGLDGIDVLCCGGDHSAVEAVLTDPRLREIALKQVGRWVNAAEPSGAVLAQAVADAWAAAVEIAEPPADDR
jgi:hypothetical protein